MGSISGSGRLPGEGNGNPIQYSCLENSTDRGVWRATVYGVAELGIIERMCTHRPDVVPGPTASALAGRTLEVQTGTSLVVQWLELCAPNVRGTGSIPG